MMKNDHISREGSSRVSWFSGYALSCCIVLLFSSDLAAQWRRIGTFDQSIASLFVQDSGRGDNFTAFAGTHNFYEYPTPDEVWKTTDGGKHWKLVFTSMFEWEGIISGFAFKDSLVGWFSNSDNRGENYTEGGCYRTTDGGETWLPMIWGQDIPVDCTAIYYNAFSKLLFLSRVSGTGYDLALCSSDEGLTWKPLATDSNIKPITLGGYAFIDSLRGFVASKWPVGYNPNYHFVGCFNTTNGGYTWNRLQFENQFTLPLAFRGSIFAITTDPLRTTVYPRCYDTLFRSTDLGNTWSIIYTFGDTELSGSIFSDSSSLYVQTDSLADQYYENKHRGLYRSTDEGHSWEFFCGPQCGFYANCFVTDYGIWAPDFQHGLWLNRTKKANADRLSFSGESATRIISGTEGTFPVSISYPHEAYYEPVDSLSFVINYCGPVSYLKDSAAAGWVVFRREVNDSSVRLILRRTDPSDPQVDSLMVKVYFQSYVGATKNATLALDEINFNQDTTFRECMIASLTKNDSLFIDFEDQCGDSILRQFVSTVSAMRITSIHPNPTSDELTVEINSQAEQMATVEVINTLGVVVGSENESIVAGVNNLRIDLRPYSNGIYAVRIRSAGGNASATFVKE